MRITRWCVAPLFLSAFASATLYQYQYPMASCPTTHIQYSTVTGYFLQDEASTNATTFDYTATNFGLINRTYSTDAGSTQWQKFAHEVLQLNLDAPSNVQYKVLFMGRHGEGYHNTAETYCGTPAWNCYWSELEGNGTVNWSDAALTPNGIVQAETANAFWAREISDQKLPVPDSYYTSPLTRCLQTANITFTGLPLVGPKAFVPEVKELFREGISMHTCDRRSNRTYIQNTFTTFTIEEGFPEDDELWTGVVGETTAGQAARSKSVLDDVFSTDPGTYISITSHSGEIASILSVIGHQAFSLKTGAIIPVLVKAETLQGSPTDSSVSSWTAIATCTAPPVTSLSTGGCVCASATPAPTSSSSS